MANQDLTFITLNVQGLRHANHRATLFSWLNCVKPDIVCLQETHSLSQTDFESWVQSESDAGNNQQSYAVLSSPGTARSAGVALLYRSSVVVNLVSHDAHGRFLVMHVAPLSEESSVMQLVIVYGPNQKRLGEDFFHSLIPVLDPTLSTILCGDFNTVPDPVLDRFGCNPNSPWAYLWPSSLSLLTSSCDLVDIWRLRHPAERDYTWRRPNGTQGSRLDMFWVSSSLAEQVRQVDIYPFFRSDHCYVFLRIGIPSAPRRGTGVWKFNSSLLADAHYSQLVREFWLEWQQERDSFSSLGVWWDAGKQRVKHLSQTYSKELARGRRHRLKSLEHTLFHLQRRQRDGEDVTALLADAKRDLETEHSHVAHGARIRARERWA